MPVNSKPLPFLGLTILLLIRGAAMASSAAENSGDFITRSGDKLMEQGREWRSIGINCPGLIFAQDGYLPSLPTPWEQEDVFKSMQQMGVTSLRIFVPSIRKPYRESEIVHRHILAPGKFDEEAFRGFDKVFELANRYHIRVIVPLVDNWAWCYGGYQSYAAFRKKGAGAFWTDPELMADFKQTVRYMLTRENYYTKIAWKDDPAILCWELGNELGPKGVVGSPMPDAWAAEISAYIKSLDSNHLVMDGSLTGQDPDVRVAAMDDPNIDIVSPHQYFHMEARKERDFTRGRKPMLIGEFGNLSGEGIRRYLDGVIGDGTSGALLWALSPHREAGGFKKHTLNFGALFGDTRTVNWPGFNDGTTFDEKGRLEAIRDAAYKIRGLPVASPSLPDPPELLPLPATLPWQGLGQLPLFNWRGSAGASGYRLERAESPDGTFTVVGENLPDGHVFYQPLATDQSAELNRAYFYRLRAMNAAGVSAPSPAIGPVIFREKLIIDDLRDFTLMQGHSSSIEIRGKAPQPYYEDYHRIHCRDGTSEIQSITYQVDAGHVIDFRVTAYGDAPVKLLVSSDGNAFQPVAKLVRETTPGYVSLWNSEEDYIQTRTIYRPAGPLPENIRFVRVSFLQAVLGRVEIGTGP